MTAEDRKAEFDRIFGALPGKNIDRIRKVCSVLHIEENTIRIYRLKTKSGRAIPQRQLKILKETLDREAAAAAPQ